MQIRAEQPTDRQEIYDLNCAAFDSPAEAKLVDALREAGAASVSIVAEEGARIVGHVMFSPVTLSDNPNLKIAGLGPVAVDPALQRAGIGKALISEGLLECARQGFGAVIVLGHKEYYPKFGFVPATRFGIRWEHECSEDAFMALELERDYLKQTGGTIRYHSAFDGV